MLDETRLRAWYGRHRAVIVTVFFAAFCVLLAAFGFSRLWDVFRVIDADLSPWWTLATALPACLLILVKDRAPMAALAASAALFVIDLLTVGGIGPLFVLLDVFWTAVFVAAPRTRRRLAFGVVIAVALLFSVAAARAPMPVAFLVAMQFAAFVGTDYWWAVAVSQANELAELHRQRAEEAERAAERDRAEAVRRERESMARELHDAVAGHVMAMAIRAEAALSSAPDEQRDRAALQAVRDAGMDAHAALRSMITVLRSGDGELQPAPRLEDLDGIVADARRAGLRVRVQGMPADELGLEPGDAAAQTVVRVVREALTNCIRHAPGAEVVVDLRRGEDAAVEVLVESRGGAGAGVPAGGAGASAGGAAVSAGGVPAGGAGSRSGGGWGLEMLTERVRTLGGTFHAGPTADGWAVRAAVPIAARAGAQR